MGNYRKLIAAAVGLALLFLYRHYGIDLLGTEDIWVELLIQAGTLVAVWYFPNTPAPR